MNPKDRTRSTAGGLLFRLLLFFFRLVSTTHVLKYAMKRRRCYESMGPGAYRLFAHRPQAQLDAKPLLVQVKGNVINAAAMGDVTSPVFAGCRSRGRVSDIWPCFYWNLHGVSFDLALLCHRDQCLPGVVHRVNRSFESEANLPAGFENIKPVGINSDHRRGNTAAVALQGAGVIIVHVLDDLQFLSWGKRILCSEFGGIEPENLSESSNESNPDKL